MLASPPLQLTCSSCNEQIQLPASVLGKQGHCHNCKQVGIIEFDFELSGGQAAVLLVAPPETEPERKLTVPAPKYMEKGKAEPKPVDPPDEAPSLPRAARSGTTSSWTFGAKSAVIIISGSTLVCVAVLWFVLAKTAPVKEVVVDGDPTPGSQVTLSPLEVLQEVTDPDHFLYPLERARQLNRTAAAQLVTGNSKGGLETLAESKRIVNGTSSWPTRSINSIHPYAPHEDKVYVLNEIAIIQFEAGYNQQAESTLETVTKELRADEVFGWHGPRSHVAVALADAGWAEEAMKMALDIHTALPRVQILTDIAAAQVRLGKPFQAHVTLQSALMEINKLAPEHSPNTFRATIAKLFSEAGHTDKAKAILTSLPNIDHFPNAMFLLCLARVREKQIMDARREAGMIKSPYWRSRAHLELAKHGQPQLSAAEVLSLANTVEEAANHLPVLKEEAMLRGEIGRFWMEFGSEHRARSALERGVQAARKMRSENERGRLLTLLASLQVRLGDLEPALTVARDHVASSSRALALKTIAQAMREFGHDRVARDTLHESFRYTAFISDPAARKSLISEIVQLQCMWGDVDKTLDNLDKLKTGDNKTRGCFEIAFWLATTEPPAIDKPGRPPMLSSRSLKMAFASADEPFVPRLLKLLEGHKDFRGD